MSAIAPTILALDFDGVICDGLIEYFQTAWGTYCQIWSPSNQTPPEELAPKFYRLRPVIEVGWEMPVLVRALVLGVGEEKIWRDWAGVSAEILREENLQAADIGAKLDRFRDEWIVRDLEGWLSLHRFYPGVVERWGAIATSGVKPYIVTTKEGRFVQQLLQQQGIEMPSGSIIGKECQRPKHQILREFIAASDGEPVSIWFVEDRLKTLQSVAKQPDLDDVRLYLADWGYNTAAQHDLVRDNPRIGLLSLSQFGEDFSNWD